MFELQRMQLALKEVIVAGIREIPRAIITRKEEGEKSAEEKGHECYQLLVEGMGLQASACVVCVCVLEGMGLRASACVVCVGGGGRGRVEGTGLQLAMGAKGEMWGDVGRCICGDAYAYMHMCVRNMHMHV